MKSKGDQRTRIPSVIDKENNLYILTFDEKPAGENLRRICELSLEEFESSNVSNLVVDLSAFQRFDKNDADWLVNTHAPRIAAAGVDKFAIVHSPSVISQMHMKCLNEETQKSTGGELMISRLTDKNKAEKWVSY